MRERPAVAARVVGAAVAVVLSSSGLLAACGDGGQPATEEGLRAAAIGYAEAIVTTRWADAYDMFSASCKEQVNEQEWTSLMQQSGYANLSDNGEVRVEGAEAVLDDGTSSGRATVTVSVNGYPQSPGWSKFVYEDGRWWFAECRFGAD
jgi:hypothetical protein